MLFGMIKLIKFRGCEFYKFSSLGQKKQFIHLTRYKASSSLNLTHLFAILSLNFPVYISTDQLLLIRILKEKLKSINKINM